MKKELVLLWGDELKDPIKRNYSGELQNSILGSFIVRGLFVNGFS